MTGQYDPKAEGQALTDANTARLARDPFATIPADDVAADQAPAVCGADTATGQCQRAPHGAKYPHVSGKYAAQADADLPNPNPPAVDLFRADWPYPVLTPVDFTALYQQAAETIKTRGYYPHEASGYADEPGISITGALKMAAHAYVKALGPHDTTDQHFRATADITEELETRLSAVLYVLGQVHTRTGISDLSDIHVSWSLAHFDIGPNPSLAAAVSLLEQAARMFAALEPVTEAPDPGRM